MQIAKGKVASFHYRVTDANGAAIDSSHERGEPLAALIGHGNIVPGLDKALQGKSAGDHFQITIAPADAYGERRKGMTQRVPKKYFHNAARLKVGMSTILETRENGPRRVVVMKVGMTTVDVDFNHPLAGRTLQFDIEVTDVRDATAEELAHGHVHGAGGHHHE